MHAELMFSRVQANSSTWGRNFSLHGAFGVDLFFVISGVVMVTSCRVAFGRHGQLMPFLQRRLLRIYPTYWLYAAARTVVVLIAGKSLSLGYVAQSFALLPVVNSAGKLRPILGVGWTLSYELYFYVALSLVLGFSRLKALALLGVALATPVLIAQSMNSAGGAWRLFLSDWIVMEFFAGALIAAGAARLRTLPLWVGILSLLAGVVWWVVMPAPSAAARCLAWGPPAALVVGGMLISESVFSRAPRLVGALCKGGDASYTLYLLHPVLFVILASLLRRLGWPGALPGQWAIVVLVALPVMLSFPAYRLLEQPLLRWTRRVLLQRR